MGIKNKNLNTQIGITPLFFYTEGVPLLFWAKSVLQIFPGAETVAALRLGKIGKFKKSSEVYVPVRESASVLESVLGEDGF